MKYMDHVRKKILLVVSIVSCLLLGSCSPWESDLENVYQAAQKEDKNAMFAVVRHYDDFKDVVPLDSFERYRQVLIESGNDAIITDAWLQEWADFRKPHPKMSDEEYEDRRNDILFKWAQIGIKYNNPDSYYDMGDYYNSRFLRTHVLEDSLMAEQYYQKAWENWHQGERLLRDRKAGVLALIKGGIAYSAHVYQTTADESFIPRLFNAGIFFSEYVMSGFLKLLFTAQWWKVLLAILILVIIISLPMIITGFMYKSTSVQNNTMGLGVMLGIWNFILIFVAYCNDNPNWVNNVGALWFPDASYGLQPYLCVIPNLFLLFLFLGNVVGAFWDDIKGGKGVEKAVLSAVGLVLIFSVSYLTAAIAGIFYIFVVILVIVVKAVLGSIPEMLGAATSSAIPSAEEISKNEEKACVLCSWYDNSSEQCLLLKKHTDRYGGDAYACSNYENR